MDPEKIKRVVISGSIIPWTEQIGISSADILTKPLSFMIFPDIEGNATGSLYFDDGKSYSYLKGEFIYSKIKLNKFEEITFQNQVHQVDKLTFNVITIEFIYLFGFDKNKNKNIKNILLMLNLKQEEAIELKFEVDENDVLLIKNISDWGIRINQNFKIKIEYE